MSEKVLIKNKFDENNRMHGYWEHQYWIYDNSIEPENIIELKGYYKHGKYFGYWERFHSDEKTTEIYYL